MGYQKTVSTFPSTNGIDTITYYIYEPEGMEPRAILQIVHGMCEYLERYEPFIEFLTENGILVCGHDQLGHGNSCVDPEKLGYFSGKMGWSCLMKDVRKMVLLMQETYKEKELPYFILGHSMGSFVVRSLMSGHGDLVDGVILSGTSGGQRGLTAAVLLTDLTAKLKGDQFRAKRVHKLAFGKYNERYKKHRTEYDWISRDEAVVDQFVQDPKCNFVFTLNGFQGLFNLMLYVTSKQWASFVPKKLPVFLIGGEMDPVGAYGSGVMKTAYRLKRAGLEDVQVKLYKEARHELLNELNKEEVYQDIMNWLEAGGEETAAEGEE